MNKFEITKNINGTEYTFTPFTVEDYAKLSSKRIAKDLEPIMVEVISKCFKLSKDEVLELPKSTAEAMIAHLWVHSMSDSKNLVNVNHNCENCGLQRNGIIDINSLYIYEDSEVLNNFEYDLTPSTKIILKEPTVFMDSDLVKMVLGSIKMIIVNENGSSLNIPVEDLNPDDIGTLQQLIDLNHFKNLTKILEAKQVLVLLNYTENCGCEESIMVKPVVGLSNILKLLEF